MAFTSDPFCNPLLFTLATQSVASATADVNIGGGNNVELRAFTATNTGGAAATAYLKFWDANSVVVGTTDPDFIFLIPAGQTVQVVFQSSTDAGVLFENGLTMAAVTTGGTGGTSNPADTIVVRLWII